MKLRDLRIDNYDWHVRFYFAVHGYHTRSILFSLEEIECPGPIMERVRENLEKPDMDSGFTYSNKTKRRSVVVVGLASSQAQFLNSFEHELRHLCDDIDVESAMQMQGEEVAYLTGQLNTMLWKDIHQFICCKGKCEGYGRTNWISDLIVGDILIYVPWIDGRNHIDNLIQYTVRTAFDCCSNCVFLWIRL